MKKCKLVLIFALLLFPLFSVSAQRNRELHIFTWEEMIPQEILDGFTRATGIKVILKNFVYNEDMLMELEMREEEGYYDLVIADDYIVDFVISEDQLAQKLDKSKLPNLKNVNPDYQHQFYDPNDEYTVPYGAGIMSIIYDPARIRTPITGYEDLRTPGLGKNVGIIGNYRVVNGMGLKALKKSYNTDNVADINAAGQWLLGLAPNVKVIDDEHLDQELTSGNISAAVVYNYMATNAKTANPRLEVVFPKEGIGFGIMPAFIPVKALNSPAAYAFLDWILDARRGAQCFEYLGYYCTFKASEQYISADMKNFVILPDSLKNRNKEMIENLSQEAEDAHARIWDTFRATAKAIEK
ncbi:MAG: spermidine/putrescine ABC transporter substrate-binding protein [Treponema sp.]|jgi:spermidine/putrescine-binding protein|nr:spermidine/putrescine ABC transporter substrate-binding protein [Treponema sp.]